MQTFGLARFKNFSCVEEWLKGRHTDRNETGRLGRIVESIDEARAVHSPIVSGEPINRCGDAVAEQSPAGRGDVVRVQAPIRPAFRGPDTR